MIIKFSTYLSMKVKISFFQCFILSTEATESVPSLERIIAARVPAAFDKKVEMPYGPAISPCVNSSMVATDGTECVSEGVEAGKNYTYTSFFDVLKSFPTVRLTNHQFCLILKLKLL